MPIWDPNNILFHRKEVKEKKQHISDNKPLGTKGRMYDINALKYIYDKIKESGVPYIQNMSTLANIAEESGGNPFANHGESFGLLQWSPDRYQKQSDDFYDELDNQLKYYLASIKDETDGVSWTHGGKDTGYRSYKNAMNDFNSNDSTKSVQGLTLGYVRPAGKWDSVANRLKAQDKLKSLFEEYKSGGVLLGKSGIHIKPENRGKFTTLKKRTGKSSTWYKEHGTPEQKKMAIFALNSKHWHHGKD